MKNLLSFLMRLRAQFGEMLSGIEVYDWSKLFKEGQRLKGYEDCTFCNKSYGQCFLGLMGHLIHQFSDSTTNHQCSLLFKTS